MKLFLLLLVLVSASFGQTRIAAGQITDQLRSQFALPNGPRTSGTWIDVARQVEGGGVVRSAPGQWELYSRTHRLTITVPWAKAPLTAGL